MSKTLEFAVADVETTGLSPRRDRVVEVAVIRLDEEGNEIGEYCSLVNPHRDLGPSDKHGIYAKDVKEAPAFEEIAGDVALLLRGAVFVAHNASFDWGFLQTELNQAGLTIPGPPRLCTMQVAKWLLPTTSSRNLQTVCDQLGIPLFRAHCAESDARASVELLRKYLNSVAGNTHIRATYADSLNEDCDEYAWPPLKPSGRRLMRPLQSTSANAEPGYLARLVAMLPAVGDITPALEEYMDLLDRILQDRSISLAEASEISECAMRLGLLREQVESGHDHYLSDLVGVAAQDGQISQSESHEICEVAELLGISRNRVEALTSRFAVAKGISDSTESGPSCLNGKSICFTGTLSRHINGDRVTRPQVEAMARQRGMVVKPRVTLDLDFLVVADPDSMSGKAKQARDYGVRILVESVFWGMIGN